MRQREDHALAGVERAGHVLVALDGEVRDDRAVPDLARQPEDLEPVAPVPLEHLLDRPVIGTTGDPALVPRRHPAIRHLRPAADPTHEPAETGDER